MATPTQLNNLIVINNFMDNLVFIHRDGLKVKSKTIHVISETLKSYKISAQQAIDINLLMSGPKSCEVLKRVLSQCGYIGVN